MKRAHRRAFRKGVRIWTCDGCGKRETWRKGWGYLACIESPANKLRSGLLLPLCGCCNTCLDVALDKLVKLLPMARVRR